ncbi:MAG: 30S ribosomal protein S16 [Candidatus Omnitrophica bacterium CG1_02_40_15]|nr:MAG: 30S ribosomal protein S16 [Candidatus Omnitrophica bacterium CG1_02_40_15]
MAVRIRLKRLGTKKKPHQRIVVCDIRRARDGKTIEELGYYDPSRKPAFISIDKERAKFWLSKGATPTEIIKSLFKKQGVI